MFDSGRVAEAFHQRAAEYDHQVKVQKRVAANLSRFVETHLAYKPAVILDVGTGTGAMLADLGRIYPDSSLCGVDIAYNMCLHATAKLESGCLIVNGDAEQIPFKAGVFDLVVSASALQWVGSISHTVAEIRRVLKPGGALCFAFYCGGTLAELHHCFSIAASRGGGANSGLTNRLHRFWSFNHVQSILERMDFAKVIMNSETETEWHADVNALLRSIKSIGAGATGGGSGPGLGWRGIISETSRLYSDRYGQDGQIPATYKVLYVYAQTA